MFIHSEYNFPLQFIHNSDIIAPAHVNTERSNNKHLHVDLKLMWISAQNSESEGIKTKTVNVRVFFFNSSFQMHAGIRL